MDHIQDNTGVFDNKNNIEDNTKVFDNKNHIEDNTKVFDNKNFVEDNLSVFNSMDHIEDNARDFDQSTHSKTDQVSSSEVLHNIVNSHSHSDGDNDIFSVDVKTDTNNSLMNGNDSQCNIDNELLSMDVTKELNDSLVNGNNSTSHIDNEFLSMNVKNDFNNTSSNCVDNSSDLDSNTKDIDTNGINKLKSVYEENERWLNSTNSHVQNNNTVAEDSILNNFELSMTESTFDESSSFVINLNDKQTNQLLENQVEDMPLCPDVCNDMVGNDDRFDENSIDTNLLGSYNNNNTRMKLPSDCDPLQPEMHDASTTEVTPLSPHEGASDPFDTISAPDMSNIVSIKNDTNIRIGDVGTFKDEISNVHSFDDTELFDQKQTKNDKEFSTFENGKDMNIDDNHKIEDQDLRNMDIVSTSSCDFEIISSANNDSQKSIDANTMNSTCNELIDEHNYLSTDSGIHSMQVDVSADSGIHSMPVDVSADSGINSMPVDVSTNSGIHSMPVDVSADSSINSMPVDVKTNSGIHNMPVNVCSDPNETLIDIEVSDTLWSLSKDLEDSTVNRQVSDCSDVAGSPIINYEDGMSDIGKCEELRSLTPSSDNTFNSSGSVPIAEIGSRVHLSSDDEFKILEAASGLNLSTNQNEEVEFDTICESEGVDESAESDAFDKGSDDVVTNLSNLRFMSDKKSPQKSETKKIPKTIEGIQNASAQKIPCAKKNIKNLTVSIGGTVEATTTNGKPTRKQNQARSKSVSARMPSHESSKIPSPKKENPNAKKAPTRPMSASFTPIELNKKLKDVENENKANLSPRRSTSRKDRFSNGDNGEEKRRSRAQVQSLNRADLDSPPLIKSQMSNPEGLPTSPKQMNTKARIGSLQKANHVPGGGNVKIETQKVDVSHVASKCGSVANIRYKPGGGDKKIEEVRLSWKAESKVGSLDKAKHKPGGGNIKIENKKLDWKAESKVGSLEKATHKPTGGNVKIENRKLEWNKTSKIGSLDNAKHRPGGGDKKIENRKLEWKTESKVGSLDNAKHTPGGGEKKLENKKLEWKKESKIGSLDNAKHTPGGGEKKIEIVKIEWKAEPKIGSLDNATHKAGGGDKKIEQHRLSFRESAAARTDHGFITNISPRISETSSVVSQ